MILNTIGEAFNISDDMEKAHMAAEMIIDSIKNNQSLKNRFH